MTSTPSGQPKGKTKEGLGIPTDWRMRATPTHTPEELSQLVLPFETIPEPKDTVPAEWANGVTHYQGGTNGVPVTGYYAVYTGASKTAKVLVSNVFGVWFEVQRRENFFECHRLARKALRLTHYPLEGIDMEALKRTSEPLSIESRTGSRLGTRLPLQEISQTNPE